MSGECRDSGNRDLGLARDLDWWQRDVLKECLGGRSRRTGFGAQGRWWFTLPGHAWPFPGLEDAPAATCAEGS
jgi:hypothetical protein